MQKKLNLILSLLKSIGKMLNKGKNILMKSHSNFSFYRKLKVPKPEKRVNFGMKIPLNMMDLGNANPSSPGPNHINGWSFVAQQHQQKK